MATKTLQTRFIIKNDTEALWLSNDPVLLKGELGIATDKNKFKIGDGTKKWSELEYSGVSTEEILALITEQRDSVYQGTRTDGQTDTEAIAAAVGSNTPKKGDTCIIKTEIASGKYSYIGFVYTGTEWAAMDGNVSADNVIMPSDILFAGDYTQVGNIKKTQTGTYTGAYTGKSISEVFTALFTKEEQPTITANPAVSLSAPENKAYEVGEKVTPTYSATLSAGSYKFGPATGVAAESWSVSNGTDTLTTSSGTFSEITVGDDTNYKITATATHNEGAVAKTNIGNNSDPVIKIASGTKSSTSSAITGYRKPFWGYKLTGDALADPTAITSAQVRSLQKSGTSANNVPTSYTVPADTKQIYFVVKAGVKNTITVKNESALNAPVAFTKVASGVQVEGANGYTAAAYDLWYANFDAAISGSAKLAISWS